MLATEFAELDAYRLEKDWSWQDLSRAMIRARCGLPLKTLHHIFRVATSSNTKPHDRTIYRIRKFLIWVEENDPAALNRARVYVAKTNGKYKFRAATA